MQWSRRKSLAGDHVLPKKAVSRVIKDYEAEYGPLTKTQKKEISRILNGKENLRPMLKDYNSSKGALNAKQWAETEMGKNASKRYLNQMDRIQRRVADQINNVINGHGGGPDHFHAFFNP